MQLLLVVKLQYHCHFPNATSKSTFELDLLIQNNTL